MSDLIRREDVIAVLCFSQETGQMVCGDLRKLLEEIKAIPSAEPERTAKVEKYSFGETLTYDFDGQCECGKWVDALWNYCPSCGARLEWDE